MNTTNLITFARAHWLKATIALAVVVFFSMVSAGGTWSLLGLSLAGNAALGWMLYSERKV